MHSRLRIFAGCSLLLIGGTATTLQYLENNAAAQCNTQLTSSFLPPADPTVIHVVTDAQSRYELHELDPDSRGNRPFLLDRVTGALYALQARGGYVWVPFAGPVAERPAQPRPIPRRPEPRLEQRPDRQPPPTPHDDPFTDATESDDLFKE